MILEKLGECHVIPVLQNSSCLSTHTLPSCACFLPVHTSFLLVHASYLCMLPSCANFLPVHASFLFTQGTASLFSDVIMPVINAWVRAIYEEDIFILSYILGGWKIQKHGPTMALWTSDEWPTVTSRQGGKAGHIPVCRKTKKAQARERSQELLLRYCPLPLLDSLLQPWNLPCGLGLWGSICLHFPAWRITNTIQWPLKNHLYICVCISINAYM